MKPQLQHSRLRRL